MYSCLVHIFPGRELYNFVYDFPCDFGGILGGYGLPSIRHMCSHYLRAVCDFFYGASGPTRGKSVQRLCGDCTEIVQCQCSCRAVSASSARKSCGDRPSHGAGAGIVQCHLQRVYGLRAYDFFNFVKLLAKPNRSSGVNSYENLTAASCLRREASRRPHGKGDKGRIRAP